MDVDLNLPVGKKVLDVSKVFKNGDVLRDAYSGNLSTVENGKIVIDSANIIVFLEQKSI